jgi:hypothetical protein
MSWLFSQRMFNEYMPNLQSKISAEAQRANSLLGDLPSNEQCQRPLCVSLRSLQAMVEACSAANCLDGEPCAPLSVMPTAHKFWRNDKMMDCLKLSQFGLTCKVLEPTTQIAQTLLKAYAQSLIALSSVADSPVKTYPPQAKAQGLQASAAACGKSTPVLLAKYDQSTHSLKTAQCSLFEDLTPCLVTLPRTGTMRNGMLYLRETLAQTISAKEFGLLPNGKTFFHTPNTTGLDGGSNSRKALKKRQQNWPTPTCNMVSGGANHNTPQVLAGKHGINLAGAVMMCPTPRKLMYPTPTCQDAKNNGGPSQYRRTSNGKPRDLQLNAEIGGALNPTWVEWLMGVPLGWSDLRPLVTRKYRFALRQHSSCLNIG